MRIQITGSRDFTDFNIFRDALLGQIGEAFGLTPGDCTVVHGGARGADSMTDDVVFPLSWVNMEVYPANWARYGSLAGPLRNTQMLDLKPDVVLAFFKGGAGNVGTRNLVTEARLRGIPVHEYWEE